MTQKNCRKVIILKAIFGCKFNYEMFELPIFCKMSALSNFFAFFTFLHTLTEPQPSENFGRGENDCNLLFYLTSKRFWRFQNDFEIFGRSNCPAAPWLRAYMLMIFMRI